MDTRSFLERVLPASGFYAALALGPKGPRQTFVDNIADLATLVTTASDGGLESYFATASYTAKGSRTQANVLASRSIFADIDCGPDKPYATLMDAIRALGDFLSANNFPSPLVVGSGGGAHCYWVLDRDLPLLEWNTIAQAFKAALAHSGLQVDPAVAADSARVLRPIGTMNYKRNGPVVLLRDVPPIGVLDFCRAVARIKPYTAATSAVLPDPGLPEQSAASKVLNAAIQIPYDGPPADASTLVKRCAQIEWAVTNQDQVPEPLWYSLLGVAAYTTDPDNVAVEWSRQHPGFNQAATLRKMEQWKKSTTGPATCDRFQGLRPEGCKGCKFLGKISTPVRLGVRFLEVAAPANAPDDTAMAVPLPRGFKRTTDGMKLTVDGADLDVCPFDIYPVGYGRDEGLGYEVCRFKWHRPHAGWQPLIMRQSHLVDGSREFATTIADQGVLLPSAKQTGYFQIMLRNYMDNLRKTHGLTNSYSSMGWKEDYKAFVIGDRVLRRELDGTISDKQVPLSYSVVGLGSSLYGAEGDRQAQIKLTSLFQSQNMPEQYLAWLSSLASILLPFTGLKGALIALCGDTGAGKTLAQLWSQSIWGDPGKLHFAAKFTANALFSRMGMLNNLPLSVDEATILDPKDAGELAYMVTQGRDKARLGKSAEERMAREWCMFMTVSMNGSFGSKLVASGQEHGAQRVRVLEINLPQKGIFVSGSADGKLIYNAIHAHYGHIGPEFVRRLLELGPDGVAAAVADAFTMFPRRYGFKFTGEERYWESIAVLCDLAGRLAYDWGLTMVRPTNAVLVALEHVRRNRTAVIDTSMDAFDYIAEYMAEIAGSTLNVTHTGRNTPSWDPNRLPRGEVRARYDLFRPDSQAAFDRGVMTIDRGHLRKWLARKGLDIKAVVESLAVSGAICTPPSGKASLGKHTPMKLPQIPVVALNVNHDRLRQMLENDALDAAAGKGIEDILLGKLKLV